MKYQNIFGLVFLASYNNLSATNYQINVKKLSSNPFIRDRQMSSPGSIEDALSGLGQLLATKSPLKMVKNVFYFTLKALFVVKIFKFLSWVFDHVEKRLD